MLRRTSAQARARDGLWHLLSPGRCGRRCAGPGRALGAAQAADGLGGGRAHLFITIFLGIFLGIFIEALPFLLLGVLASAAIQLFVSADWLQRLSPRAPLPAALLGATLGRFCLPVCECGTVPATRHLLALPLALGLLTSARPLGADALAMTGLGTGSSVRADAPESEDSRRWNLLHWATAVSVRGAAMQGHEADLVGFVYHDPLRPLDGFVVARLVIVCCVADGSGVSLPVVWPGGASLAPNTWVRVRGTLGSATLGGRSEAAFLATVVEIIPQLADPYLYP